MARIITGSAKNTLLNVPSTARPITDRAKSALFSILSDSIINKRILDLYAGSGSLGLEALSRGAKSAVFVDNSNEAVEITKKNIKKTHFNEKSKVFKSNVEEFLKTHTKEGFDVIFIDPPYEKTSEKDIISAADLLSPSGIIIVKHSPKFTAPKNLSTQTGQVLEKIDERGYGENMITFYES